MLRLSKYRFGTRDNRKNGKTIFPFWECALTKCPALSNWQCRLKGDSFQSCEVIRQQDVEKCQGCGGFVPELRSNTPRQK